VSREQRHVEVTFTVNDPDHLPPKDGQQLYADDVAGELYDAVQAAVDRWYEQRGRELLACEPLVI
jgi:hypothetical protein